jgi:hypothetical protein
VGRAFRSKRAGISKERVEPDLELPHPLERAIDGSTFRPGLRHGKTTR